MKYLSLFFLLVMVAVACNNDEKLSKEIVGEWHGVSWTGDGEPVIADGSKMTMILSKEGIYNLVVEDQIDSGDWKVKNDTLVLSPEKSEDVKMRIVSLTHDNLKLKVDRGRIEDIEFKR